MVVETLDLAGQKVSSFSPRKKWYRRFCRRSAVAIILKTSDQGLEALMIKRAERKGDPWSGHMAFPGGRVDDVDKSILDAARRETMEEIGLETSLHTNYLSRMSDVITRPHRGRKPMVVTPYLFSMDTMPEFSINHEVADIIWVPLSFLANRDNRKSMQWRVSSIPLTLPCYFYQEQRIWGISLMMLDELINVIKK